MALFLLELFFGDEHGEVDLGDSSFLDVIVYVGLDLGPDEH